MKITVNTTVYSGLQMSDKPHHRNLLSCGLVCVLSPFCCRSFLFITYVDMFFYEEDAGKGAVFEHWLIFSALPAPNTLFSASHFWTAYAARLVRTV
jgi:hypothetical protein